MKLLDFVGYFLRRAMEGENWEEAEEAVFESMISQGYNLAEINVALSVVNRVREQMESALRNAHPLRTNRIFEYIEMIRLSTEARGYLHQMVASGAITPLQREEIVEKCLLVDSEVINLEEVRYVTQMVMAGEPMGNEDGFGSPSPWYH